MSQEKVLKTTDYVVFSIGLLVSLATGIYFAYKERRHVSPFYFHRGGGKLSTFPVAMSLIVTFESSISYLGFPAEVYIHGFEFFIGNIGVLIGFMTMFFVSIPLFYPLNVTSVYEYLQMRHDSLLIRQIATALGTIFMIIYAGIVLYGTAVALQSVTGLSIWTFIFSVSVIAVIYTSLGGIKAVVITDLVQGIIMIVMMFIVLIYGTVCTGGVQRVIDLNKPSGRLKLIDLDPNPLTRHTFWTLVLGNIYKYFGYCIRQPVVQRLNSTKSMKEAKKVVALSIFGFLALDTLAMLEGIVVFAYFANKGCDPLASGQISSPNQIISFAVLDMFDNIPGLTGLYLAALCCASLSTISSLLSSVSAIVSEDFIRTKWKTISDVRLTNASKFIILVCGIVCIGTSIIISFMKESIQQITAMLLGIVDGPIVSVFILSIFMKSSTKKGLVVSTIVSLSVAIWLSTGFHFSAGRKQTLWLPFGPTDRCYNKIDSQTVENAPQAINHTENEVYKDITVSANDTILKGNMHGFFNGSGKCETFRNESVLDSHQMQGLDYLYSVSYLYFPIIVLIISLISGVITNRLTKLERQTPVQSYLMLAMNKRFLKCQPNFEDVSEDLTVQVDLLNVELQ